MPVDMKEDKVVEKGHSTDEDVGVRYSLSPTAQFESESSCFVPFPLSQRYLMQRFQPAFQTLELPFGPRPSEKFQLPYSPREAHLPYL